MVELFRIVQSQMADRYAQKATLSQATADALDRLLETTKLATPSDHQSWDALIATPFRYPLPTDPLYLARFRPPHFRRNVWYGSQIAETSFYEAAYHLMKERVHLDNHEETGLRTLFSVHCDLSGALDLSLDSQIDLIMDRNSYDKSHDVAKSADNKTGIIYPSCRDPKKKQCAAMFEITCFQKTVASELTIRFHYQKNKSLSWLRIPNYNIKIAWGQVS
jgi:hypothetical protein